jgi:hypothetical protein
MRMSKPIFFLVVFLYESQFSEYVRVRVVGLENQPEFNGKKGLIMKKNDSNQEVWEVFVYTDKVRRVGCREENLQMLHVKYLNWSNFFPFVQFKTNLSCPVI